MRRSCLLSLLAIPLLVLLAAASARAEEPVAGAVRREPATGMEFVWVPGGALPPSDPQQARDPYYGDDPDRLRRIGGFWIGRFEVTQEQWERAMGANPAHFRKGGAYPVESVSLADVRAFLERLNGTGEARFRLPTDQEWGHAARSGGGPERYAGGSNAGRLGWHKGNSGGTTHPVGRKAPNRLGIFDMSGNVREWCGGAAATEPPADALAALLATHRGGGFDDPPTPLETIGLGRDLPDFRRSDLGLRLVLEP